VKKVLLGVGFLVVLGSLVALNLVRNREKAVEVEVHRVARKNLVARVSGSGQIEARKSVSVTSSVIGKVLEVAVREGDTVAEGQLILRIDPADQQAIVEQAKAELARAEALRTLAEAELRQAEFELNRLRDLRKGDLASAQELEAAETAREVQQARVAEAQEGVRNSRAGVSRAEHALSKTIVKAEIPGVVVRLAVEEGENVLAGDLYNAGSPIVVVADLAQMEAQVLVDETEVVDVRVGQDAEVTIDAFPGRKLSGHVTEVGNSAYNAGPLGSQEAKDFRVRILLEPGVENLRPGLSARGEIVTETRENALAVPIAALTVRDPEKKRTPKPREKAREKKDKTSGSGESREVDGVFVVRADSVRFVPVTTGIAGEKDFEVVEGLSEGDEVVEGPFDALRNLESGDRVKVNKAEESSDSKEPAEEKPEEAPA
jgi:HlyD family secretion protein